eukprot:PITA_04816
MDVKKTFLHGDLEEEIYMKQPEGFAVKGKKELVFKLKKSLYGLKQSPKMWYQRFDTFIWGLGFTRSKANHCVYFKLIGDRVIYLVLYVDDMLLVGNDKEIIQDLKTQLSSKFDMKYLGATNYILGMEIKIYRAKRKIWLNQRRYVEKIIQRFNMQDSKLVKVPIPVGVRLSVEQCPKTEEQEEDMSHAPYASVVGSLMYAMSRRLRGQCPKFTPSQLEGLRALATPSESRAASLEAAESSWIVHPGHLVQPTEHISEPISFSEVIGSITPTSSLAKETEISEPETKIAATPSSGFSSPISSGPSSLKVENIITENLPSGLISI